VDDESKKVVKVEKSQSYTSIISRLFQGQFHSLLTCPVCKSGSEKVEPFLFLPLHIPDIKFHQIPVCVTVVRYCVRDAVWEKVMLRLPMYETVKDLRVLLAERMSIKFNEVCIHILVPKTFEVLILQTEYYLQLFMLFCSINITIRGCLCCVGKLADKFIIMLQVGEIQRIYLFEYIVL